MADAYQIALAGCSYEALKTVAQKAMRGEIEELSSTFGPTPPELARAVRQLDQEFDRQKALAAPAPNYQPKPFQSIQMRIDATRQRMTDEGRKFICSVDSHSAAVEMMRRGKLPPGFVYSGLLGEFYGPIHEPQPEGTDHEREQSIPDFAARYGPSAGLPAGSDQIGDGTGAEHENGGQQFGPDEPAEWQTDNSEASGTIDGDRGSGGPSIAAE